MCLCLCLCELAARGPRGWREWGTVVDKLGAVARRSLEYGQGSDGAAAVLRPGLRTQVEQFHTANSV